MVAVLVCGLGLTTRTCSCNVCGGAALPVPTAQAPVIGLYDLWLGVAARKLSPAGRGSVTVTPVAASGPLLVSVTVKVMTSPTLGVGLLTDLVIPRSACRGVSVVLAVLLPPSGSNWSLWLTVAVLVVAAGLTTRAWTASVALAPPAKVQTPHRPVALVYVP